jgi:hypothetical protein
MVGLFVLMACYFSAWQVGRVRVRRLRRLLLAIVLVAPVIAFWIWSTIGVWPDPHMYLVRYLTLMSLMAFPGYMILILIAGVGYFWSRRAAGRLPDVR